MEVYRFISFPTFINLVETKKERYTNPFCWEDTYEALFLQFVKDKNSRYEILNHFINNLSPDNIMAAIGNFIKLYNI